MDQDWTILTNRLGADYRNPSDARLESAIEDLHSHLDDQEHCSIILRRGSDDGEMLVLELFSGGALVYSHYADSEYESLLAEFRAEGLGALDITRRFRYLRDGDTHSLSLCVWTKTK